MLCKLSYVLDLGQKRIGAIWHPLCSVQHLSTRCLIGNGHGCITLPHQAQNFFLAQNRTTMKNDWMMESQSLYLASCQVC